MATCLIQKKKKKKKKQNKQKHRSYDHMYSQQNYKFLSQTSIYYLAIMTL